MNDEQQTSNGSEVAGAGMDKSVLTRPGIPQEQEPPEPLASAHWLEPEQQMSPERPLVGKGMKLTPVFSSALPARGLSGLLRRGAYRIPDYRARRWLVLMLADRIDVLEHRPSVLLKAVARIGLIGLGFWALRRALRS